MSDGTWPDATDTGRRTLLGSSILVTEQTQALDRWGSKNKGNLFCEGDRVCSEVICATAEGNNHLHLTQITFRSKAGFILVYKTPPLCKEIIQTLSNGCF